MDTRTGLPIVGMVGGGQLARMTHQAAIALGQSLHVLAVSPDDPAALVSPNITLGSHTDLGALTAFAKSCDVLTFDHEHVPGEHLRALADQGVHVRPGPDALLHAQDKLVMRRRLGELGLPIPPFAEVRSVEDVVAFAGEHGWPCVLKAARGGYDGRGVWMLNGPHSAGDLVPTLLEAGTSLLVEQRVAMRRELAALVARSPFGQGGVWPVVETVQSNGICVEVLAPAPGLSETDGDAAQELALRIASELGVVGVLAVELFDTDAGLVINELAMRPHNSGHWTIEGARTSQFEQHLRAVLDYPLGATDVMAPAVVMANVLGAPDAPAMSPDERLHHLLARFRDAHVHYYGKQERPGRKIGHVTMLGASMADVRERAKLAAHWLSHAEWLDGYDIHGS
ncbi:5-(carboxyamino)imidazole ribonucleotide synthase [Actinophytocola algeriensis]|uniref:N5-carboxyaminoimidazole ribonucleotide synthase n=1 Tax=Actinophytocola algeriensis TaxID=1768010 RepID=A0A7W7PZ75_9PSEU|nr:5-(carboxyamino)imidazole ribonucleotide synthase [Actinophytocola algeriensis]MBB4903903.1 5-(carboxyamino)imidazole ribonucleotide synthase [Actinophytocola algeriensis]MBE1477240.1 5-(carboxyamino)imidazole ribonucleotide synthase [Actinophytocola algeriensis]